MMHEAAPFPPVAIITRTRDRPRLLTRCIESVLDQTFGDFLHVIVNDGGAPETIEATLAPYRDRYGARLMVIHRAQSTGMEAATNAGLRGSASTYVVVFDDDDTWHPTFLERTLAALAAPDWPNTRGVTCASQIVYERIEGDEIIEEGRVSFNEWVEHMDLFRLFALNRFTGVGFLYERSVLDEIGYYDEGLEVCGDWDFNLRFLARFEIRMLRETLAFYHQRRALTGAYGNTVIEGWPNHIRHRIKLSNQWVRDGLKGGTLDFGQLFALGNLVEYHELIAAHRPREEERHRELMARHQELVERHQELQERQQQLAAQHQEVMAQVGALQATLAQMRDGLERIERSSAHAADALDAAAANALARKLKRRERRTFRYWHGKVCALFRPARDGDHF